MAHLDPVGPPEGELHNWILSDDHEENDMEDLGWLELRNGFRIDLGRYRGTYCVKVYLVLENSDRESGPIAPEVNLMSEFMDEAAFTTNGPLIALKQFVDISNYFERAKIKIKA